MKTETCVLKVENLPKETDYIAATEILDMTVIDAKKIKVYDSTIGERINSPWIIL